MWFKRAGNHLLSVSLHEPSDDAVAALIWRYGGRLRHLEICHEAYHPYLWAPVLLGPFKFLETLTITCRDHFIELSVHRILEILRHAPNLVECTLDGVLFTEHLDDHTRTEQLVLPGLRNLNFSKTYDWDLEGDAGFLTCLTLPALETLVVADLNKPTFIHF
ncbi:hypothetical protein B0H19DRAFT_1248858 [Mycena capillaripes]|nr:hypothetical protein B0H19DRAFT_1248858 [Mycena capillaripes]